MVKVGTIITEGSSSPSLTPGLEGKGFNGDGAAVMALSRCTTCLHCSWSLESSLSSPRVGLDDSPSPFCGSTVLVGLRSLAFNVAWLCLACLGVPGVLKENPSCLCICAGIFTRQKTCHNVQPITDVRASQGCLAACHINPFLTSFLLQGHNPLIPIRGHVLQLLLLCPFYPSTPHKASFYPQGIPKG